MMQKSDKCTICLNKDAIYWIEELDENNLRYAAKLESFLPQVEWNQNDYFCNFCLKDLDVAYKFKQQCLASRLILQKDLNNTHFDQNIRVESNLEKSTEVYKKETETSVENDIVEDFQVDYLPEYVCQVCNESFTTENNLFEHNTSVHHKKYTCMFCDKLCRNELELTNHKKIHKHVCNICNKSYSSKQVLQKHIEIKHMEKKFWKHYCCYCNEIFPTKTYLLKHSKRNHATQETVVCSHCSKDFQDKNILLYHIVDTHQKKAKAVIQKENIVKELEDSHKNTEKTKENILNSLATNENINNYDSGIKRKPEDSNKTPSGKKRPCRRFTCENCDKIMNSSKKLIEHCVDIHNLDAKSIKPFACDLCDKKFSTSTILIEHKRYHTRNRQNICSYCGKGFITKNDLNCHEYIHLNERGFKCDICFKGFNTQKNLRTHKIVKHGDPMSWKHCCNICNKRFAILSNYKVHVRRHMGDKQFCCHLCDKKFVNKDELRQHTDSHSNVREFKCQQCGKEYKKKRVYEIHLAKIHGIGDAKIPKKEKKHMCHMCPKSYYDKSKLKRHLLGHAGIKPYACTKCDKKFNDNYYLKQHMKNSHEVDLGVF